ncbi:76fefeef-2e40-4ff3-9798-a1e5d3bd86fd [Sclerotinia trifoliorum]|uniref:aldehyde dehydrogenase (NAD(+)) n=1 Tax=Sclerotinia trifoliorum TaxID=28548 RepID=A0A8H2ZPL3_9HELO|nr:76fefeef-2e40-4ff3-9798-a1e5d3bd86fd [Sclerotinia trifoliorum]
MASQEIDNRMDFVTFQNTIDGKLCNTTQTRQSINPATGEANPPVPLSTKKELDESVHAAKKAQKSWSRTTITERRDLLLEFADAYATYESEFVNLLISEQGKAKFLAHDEFARSLAMIRETTELLLTEEVVAETDTMIASVRYVPIGVGCGMVPWNYPILLAMGKLVPAVWAGNAIIIKPSPDTPYCALKIVELANRFLPPGVVQALSGGHEFGPLCTLHPGIDKIAFTGSIETGKKVMESCAKTLKRVTLELGGNDSCIVCEDVDIENVVPQIAQLALMNSGQICMDIKRLYVHADIYDQFLSALVSQVSKLKVGPGADPTSWVGPLQNKAQLNNVQTFYDDIEKNGLKVAYGGSNDSIKMNDTLNKGYFANPTIIDNPPESERIVQLEPFGPIFPILKWSGEDEDIVDRVNDTITGLGASVWSKDIARAEKMARGLQAGSVWVNTHFYLSAKVPYGGFKNSGIGMAWGLVGLKHWCNVQSVWLPREKSKI